MAVEVQFYKSESLYRGKVRNGWSGKTSTGLLFRRPLSMSSVKPEVNSYIQLKPVRYITKVTYVPL